MTPVSFPYRDMGTIWESFLRHNFKILVLPYILPSLFFSLINLNNIHSILKIHKRKRGYLNKERKRKRDRIENGEWRIENER
jgi:hypothetical protein